MNRAPITAQLNPNQASDNENLQNLIPDQTTESFINKFKRKFGKIPKTVAACIVMLICGIILLILPSCINSLSKSGTIGMYVVGSLLLIPSVYVAYILYHVFNDTPGFQIDGLPIWDE